MNGLPSLSASTPLFLLLLEDLPFVFDLGGSISNTPSLNTHVDGWDSVVVSCSVIDGLLSRLPGG
jgi:hypothetical protein